MGIGKYASYTIDKNYLDYYWDDTNPIFLIDFYKFGHVDQYPKGIKRIWVNFTPRSTRIEGETGVIFFGLRRFIKKVLIQQFNDYFFSRSWSEVEAEYKQVMKATLGVDARVDHIKQLHDHQTLPLDIYAVPEGTYVPLGVPAMVIVNNEDWAFWLPNYIETMCSNNLWHACTSASTALRYRRLFIQKAKEAGETDLSFIDWQGHDFSYRGLSGDESAKLSGMGHLLSFSGTDTLPAILDAVKYYGAELSVGGSVPATEHSVMCAGGKEDEQETFRRLIEDVYPKGIVSIVSDTWNFWKVLNQTIPALRDKILTRDGKVVIRPDSGDPVEILTGVKTARTAMKGTDEWCREWGALWSLAEAVGISGPVGRWMLNRMGLIYGDSITLERADAILSHAVLNGFSPYNYVFGIGSYTYQYVTRDTYNFAFKATAIETADGVQAIFKDPITDNAHKKSHRGIPVTMAHTDGSLYVHETLDPEALKNSVFQHVFDGEILIDQNFADIRERVRSYAE